MYIAGGIAAKVPAKHVHALLAGTNHRAWCAHQNLSWVTDNTIFMDAFRDKGRVSPKLKEVAVKLVMYPDVGLRGAHYCAYNTLAKYVGEA